MCCSRPQQLVTGCAEWYEEDRRNELCTENKDRQRKRPSTTTPLHQTVYSYSICNRDCHSKIKMFSYSRFCFCCVEYWLSPADGCQWGDCTIQHVLLIPAHITCRNFRGETRHSQSNTPTECRHITNTDRRHCFVDKIGNSSCETWDIMAHWVYRNSRPRVKCPDLGTLLIWQRSNSNN